jgi:hypothetical protein
MTHLRMMDNMGINIFPAVADGKWEIAAPRKVRGRLISIGPMNSHRETFQRLSQAVHRAFCMKERVKAYSNLPVWLTMARPPSVAIPHVRWDDLDRYILEREEDALFIILQHDQS